MISAKKLIKLAGKWQKMAAASQKRLTIHRTIGDGNDGDNCSIPSTVEKGHFVVYSIDQRRFVLPLKYLNNKIVQELFNIAEEEFGLPGNGPLLLPFYAEFIEYVMGLIHRGITKEVEKAVLISAACAQCSSSLVPHHGVSSQQLLLCSY